MLALAILSTIFLGISCITTVLKNTISCDGINSTIFWTMYGLLWRALAITSIWVLYVHIV